eukprot:CAMPEP_0113509978 /NCGR_PEP_ID=MMETSP0014_2-20120614/37874_1 /TAXON_ID=2857 /ORGANISM="Nitzschia sp." /LENGTH=733 /DNA_ID=CAMNT_0000405865 /DNA_START=430 /DNA_END=2628 /DNA_ORIENTATION=+ /assembly_acc=CAM_ASM_000159
MTRRRRGLSNNNNNNNLSSNSNNENSNSIVHEEGDEYFSCARLVTKTTRRKGKNARLSLHRLFALLSLTSTLTVYHHYQGRGRTTGVGVSAFVPTASVPPTRTHNNPTLTISSSSSRPLSLSFLSKKDSCYLWKRRRDQVQIRSRRGNNDDVDEEEITGGPFSPIEKGGMVDSPIPEPQVTAKRPKSKQPTRVTGLDKAGKLTTLALSVMLSASLALFGNPDAALAGFGPSSGATTTPPPGLTRPNVADAESLSGKSGKKLKILIGSSLDENRLREFNSQLDIIIEALRDRNENNGASDSSSTSSTDNESSSSQLILDYEDRKNVFATSEELERALIIQTQIQDRERMLDKLEAQPYWFNYLAAFIGSIASTLVMHPVDTIKTRLMLEGAPKQNATDETDYVNVNGLDHTTVSSIGTDTATVEKGDEPGNTSLDIGSLYEGLTGNLLKEGPPSALYLGVYETVKSYLVPRANPNLLLLVYLVAGAAGEMVGSVVRAPAEAVKSKVQSKSADSATAFDAAQRVLGTPEGLQNVLRAWSASIGRDVPFGAIQLATFEVIKAAILNNPNIDFDSSTLQAEAIIGAFAGALGAFLTTPADVITTRIITQSIEPETDYDDIQVEMDIPVVHNQTETELPVEAVVGSRGSDYKYAHAVDDAINGSTATVLAPTSRAVSTSVGTNGAENEPQQEPSHDDEMLSIVATSSSDSIADQPLGVVDMTRKIYEEEGIEAFFTGW